jgi:hypothetical protein
MRTKGDPYAYADIRGLPTGLYRPRNGAHHALSHLGGMLLRGLPEENRELVAAEPRDHAARTGLRDQTCRDLAQEHVAGFVTPFAGRHKVAPIAQTPVNQTGHHLFLTLPVALRTTKDVRSLRQCRIDIADRRWRDCRKPIGAVPSSECRGTETTN